MVLGELAGEEAEAGDEAGPGEAVVGVGLDDDFKGVAGLGAVDGDGAGEGVDFEGIEAGGEVCGGPIGADLVAGGVGALEGDGVAGGDGEAGGVALFQRSQKGRGERVWCMKEQGAGSEEQ